MIVNFMLQLLGMLVVICLYELVKRKLRRMMEDRKDREIQKLQTSVLQLRTKLDALKRMDTAEPRFDFTLLEASYSICLDGLTKSEWARVSVELQSALSRLSSVKDELNDKCRAQEAATALKAGMDAFCNASNGQVPVLIWEAEALYWRGDYLQKEKNFQWALAQYREGLGKVFRAKGDWHVSTNHRHPAPPCTTAS